MRTRNSYYFNAYNHCSKILLLIIVSFEFACSKQIGTNQSLPAVDQTQISVSAININTATAEEIEKLPDIGQQKAREIVEHRERFGRFRKPEHLLLVRGISDNLFRKIKDMVKVE